MRPVRALVVVAVGVAFWAGWRGAAVRDELATTFTPLVADSAPLPTPLAPTPMPNFGGQVPAAPGPGAPGGTPPGTPPGTPEVMVYSYPAPPGSDRGAMPRPNVWRVSARARTPRGAALAAAAPAPATVRRPAASPRAPDTPPDMHAAAYEAATRAYANLRVGDRRGAAGAFAVALSLAPDHPNAKQWAHEARLLSKHWRAEAYTFLRQADGSLTPLPETVPLPSASPVLGQGATAATLAYTLNPLSRHQVELQARVTTPYRGFSKPDSSSSQGAVGVAVRPFAKLPVTLIVERLFKLGVNARNDFQARATAGATRRIRGFDVSAFGEAGVVGRNPDYFAGAQLIAEKPVKLPAGFGLGFGVGAWGSMQHTDRTASRLDIGPTIRLNAPKTPITLRVDYRAHVAGNARPGSGVAVTASADF